MRSAADGKMAAAQELGATVLRPEIRRVLDTYQQLDTDEARARYADHFLSRTAGVMDDVWPAFYRLLKLVETGELYRQPGYMSATYDSFADYFEQRVKRPFSTWSELEGTYHYVRDHAPELYSAPYGEAARKVREANARDAANAPRQGVRTDLVNSSRPDFVDNVHEVKSRPTGNAQAAALRRLRTQRPDLHERVLAGEVSPHGAMIEAGFRRKTITIPVDCPEAAARSLRRHMSPDDIDALIDALQICE